MRILLIILFSLLTKEFYGQDSTTSVYINDLVKKIESRLSLDILEKKDTSIYDEADTLQTGNPLIVHTEFFTDSKTLLLDKIVEKSLYRKYSTELTVYFQGNQPVLFCNKQWDGSSVRVDFDIYYMNGNTVNYVKRTNLKGVPDGDQYLKWCYQLRKEYNDIVMEYNTTFRHGKLR